MKHATATLEGALLDAAVAKAEGWLYVGGILGRPLKVQPTHPSPVPLDAFVPEVAAFPFSTDWQHGGPIIERERIVLVPSDDGIWSASVGARNLFIDDPLPFDVRTIGTNDASATGPTPLVAAMRAYVTSKFGAEVELP